MSDLDSSATPTKQNMEDSEQTPKKRRGRGSNAEKANEESQAILKEMGFDDSVTPGRRRTRAATRGEVYTPPPKRQRRSAGSTPPSSGGRSRRKTVTPEKSDEPMEVAEPESVETDEPKETVKPASPEVIEPKVTATDKPTVTVKPVSAETDAPMVTAKPTSKKEIPKQAEETVPIIEQKPKGVEKEKMAVAEPTAKLHAPEKMAGDKQQSVEQKVKVVKDDNISVAKPSNNEMNPEKSSDVKESKSKDMRNCESPSKVDGVTTSVEGGKCTKPLDDSEPKKNTAEVTKVGLPKIISPEKMEVSPKKAVEVKATDIDACSKKLDKSVQSEVNVTTNDNISKNGLEDKPEESVKQTNDYIICEDKLAEGFNSGKSAPNPIPVAQLKSSGSSIFSNSTRPTFGSTNTTDGKPNSENVSQPSAVVE